METIGNVIYMIANAIDNDLLDLNFDFKNKQIILTFGEAAIPVLIHPIREFIQGDGGVQGERTAAAAELYTELLRENLCSYDVERLNKVIQIIEANADVLESYLNI